MIVLREASPWEPVQQLDVREKKLVKLSPYNWNTVEIKVVQLRVSCVPSPISKRLNEWN